MAIAIDIQSVSRTYGPIKALDGIDLSIKAGEFFTLLGSSGCGKSTLLKLIGGFDRPSEGRILFDGRDVIDVPANKRPVNTVFQSLALFPHMTVAENVGYGLKLRGVSGASLKAKVEDALDLVELPGFGSRTIGMMSGGQRQRVALARALVMEPGILLLDEPLTGLDERLRQQMRDEFGRLHRRTGATFILVTHNQDEALSLSDRMAIMHKGRIEQLGVPAQFFERPANSFVARFVGIETLLKPERIEMRDDGPHAIVAGQSLRLRSPGASLGADGVVAIRPDRLRISENIDTADLVLTVVETTFRGLQTDVRLTFADGQSLVAVVSSDSPTATVKPGTQVPLSLLPDAAMLLSGSGMPPVA
ncbi:ABC-type Fe3+/spermidine/putrescine transport system ATPase subunit [Rhizobium sp. PP-WC-2G-219]|nr:ABC-type Fe3+/spermidine/putrescine transport system ATPase subunit [Rhizobium sp. PP-WC-2G-219]